MDRLQQVVWDLLINAIIHRARASFRRCDGRQDAAGYTVHVPKAVDPDELIMTIASLAGC